MARFWLFAVVVLVWLVWKLAYYGDVIPNTFYAKAGDGWTLTVPAGVRTVTLAGD